MSSDIFDVMICAIWLQIRVKMCHKLDPSQLEQVGDRVCSLLESKFALHEVKNLYNFLIILNFSSLHLIKIYSLEPS